MGKTWRERIAEAEACGHFEYEDICEWRRLTTCPAAEVARSHGVEYQQSILGDGRWAELWVMGHEFGDFLWNHRMADASRLLDAIEDRGLEIKREAAK